MSLSSLKILVDSELWRGAELFSTLGEVICLPGRRISSQDLEGVDVLVIRSITRVDEHLLGKNSSIKLVLSVTAGFDHLDVDYLALKKISWVTMRGFNASPVGDYVLSVLARLWQDQKIPADPRIAIVGVGAAGQQVQARLQALGLDIFLCDPLRARAEKTFAHVPLLELENIDVFCFHVPLTYQGMDSTFHFLEKSFLQKQKPGCVILNASRGEILDSALISEFSKTLGFCLDVFEQEPNIDVSLLSHLWMATPHIAGYSVQSKQRGVCMAVQACAQFFDLAWRPQDFHFSSQEIRLTQTCTWRELILQLFDPGQISLAFKNALQKEVLTFDAARQFFPIKHELAQVTVKGCEHLDADSKTILKRLQLTLLD